MCPKEYDWRGCGHSFTIRRRDVFNSELIHEGAVDEIQGTCCPNCHSIMYLNFATQYQLPDVEELPNMEEWAEAHNRTDHYGRLVPKTEIR